MATIALCIVCLVWAALAFLARLEVRRNRRIIAELEAILGLPLDDPRRRADYIARIEASVVRNFKFTNLKGKP